MNEQKKPDSNAVPAAASDTSLAVVPHDPWQAIRRFTPARIALGRAGNALPTREVLRFSLAHALARDAVHWQLDLDQLQQELQHDGFQSVLVHSAVQDRTTYLLRPDQGRRLGAGGLTALSAHDGPACDLALVLADGLSAIAVQKHAVPLLRALRPLLPPEWSLAPVVIAQQARVALGDEIGQCLRAKMVVMLIGERPGLSSPDSLGAYLTSEPRVGRMDSERNCVSNIRPQGLGIEAAARRIAWLLVQGRQLGLTGVALKDESGGLPAVGDETAKS